MPAQVDIIGTVAHIRLDGEFDYSSQDKLGVIFEKALKAKVTEIEVDLARTIFIDSAILRLLLGLHGSASSNHKPMHVVHCSEQVLEIFRIGGFDQVFDIR